jgi:upstream activation factor subunit UAF30
MATAKKPAAATKKPAAAAIKPAAVKKAAPAKAPKVAKEPTVRKANTAFMKPMTLSPVLAAVIGSTPIPRTEVTKKIWEYIKKHKLQDETNKRMINGDAKLVAVFNGKKQVSMFEMTKYISAHLS